MSVEQVAGQDVYVRRPEGEADALMIHCTMARHEALRRLAALRPEQSILFDLPGHGRSSHAPEGADIHDQTTDIARTLLPTGGAHVFGHSFGATVALRLALEDPRVTRLTLVEPVLFAAARGMPGYMRHVKDYAPVDAAFAVGDDLAAAKGFLAIWGAGMPWEVMPEKMREEALNTLYFVTGSEAALHHDSAGILAPGRLEGLDIPVTLIAGEKTHPVMSDIHATLSGRLPLARVATVPGAGHMVPVTHPREVVEIMAESD